MQRMTASWGTLALVAVLGYLMGGAYSAPAPQATAPGKAPPRPAAGPSLRPDAILPPYKPTRAELRVNFEQASALAAKLQGRVFKAKVTPHWFENNTRFWYRNDLRDGGREFLLVDATAGTRRPAFDHAKLAAALSKAAGVRFTANRLPFDRIDFTDGNKAIAFHAAGADWRCDLASYECVKQKAGAPAKSALPPAAANDEAADESSADGEEAPQRKKGGKRPPAPRPDRAVSSPDGKWTAAVKDFNVVLREPSGKEWPLTTDGSQGDAYGSFAWSPDSKTLVAYRTRPGDGKLVYMIETSPRDQLPAKLHQRPYPRPGDKFPAHEMWLFDVAAKKPIKAAVERIDFRGVPRLRWHKDGRHFTFERTDRGHQRFRILEVERQTGKVRHILEEKAQTFIDHYSYRFIQYLDDTDEILYTSEMDGWKHVYLIDAKAGQIKNRVTRGDWVVRRIERVDVAKRQILFRASGKNAGQDPYQLHYYRVNFDGSGLVALTEGDGNHEIAFSPDGKHLLDTYSRPDLPPVTELRRAADGKLVCPLETADVSALQAVGWNPPEVFSAKGRDGKTDILGVVYRPMKLDPKKKYPIIEYIYAGPHDSFVPKTFSAYRGLQALAELGFIVVQIDGMGTANRSRAFHDVCWKNIADAGFPDRILWIKALAKRYAYLDTDRVGIFGTSAGGQSALGALLFHGYFYKVAVSSCGCHDNRLDKDTWNEQWMGLFGPHYEAQSNVTNAHKLIGKLLLIVGELDTNVPFESTMRVVDALIRARKDFDLFFVPGMGHSDGGKYGEQRRRDFFVRHLHGVEPPDRNNPTAAPAKPAAVKVTTVPEALRVTLKLDPWYRKHTAYKGLPILSSGKVSDAALVEARYLIGQMLAGRDDVLKAMVEGRCRFVVMAPTEMTTDVPEQRNMKPKDYWDKRARGLGGRVTSCGEENLLNLKGDRYRNENILIHEFAHAIHNHGLRKIDPKFDGRLRATYARAMEKGLWKKTYAATNAGEYWAEGVQSYFDCNAPPGGVHNDVNTREKLAKYDPELFRLIDEVFRQSAFRYVRYDKRKQPKR